MTPDERTAAGIAEPDPRRVPGERGARVRRAQPGRHPEHAVRRPRLRGGTCAYYQWIQGTSMASPHAVGCGGADRREFGKRGPGGIALNPATRSGAARTRRPITRVRSRGCTATRTRAVQPRQAFCEGTPRLNGFYGHGIVDALAAVTSDLLSRKLKASRAGLGRANEPFPAPLIPFLYSSSTIRAISLRGPCTPSTRFSSMSEVADGPDTNVSGRFATPRRASNASGTVSTT